MADPAGGDIEIRPVNPTEALRYFRGKGLAESFAWQDVWQEEHARAFTVAKSTGAGILGDVREQLDRALAEGRTLEQFRQDLRPQLQAKGWWGKQQMVDPLTGEERLVQLGSARRLETIYQVNLRTAYMAGVWERAQRSKRAFPYLRYVAVEDARTRPEHRAWHGAILPIDHPWWDTHFPPCGWNCRCRVMQVSDRMLADRGWKVTEIPPRFPPRAYTNPRTGEVSVIEGGIDPGFSYNVGRAYLERETPSPAPPRSGPLGDGGAGPILSRPGPALAPREISRTAAIADFLAGFGASAEDAAPFADVVGEMFVAGPGLFRSASGRPAPLTSQQLRALPIVGAAIRDPQEVWRVWVPGPARKDGLPTPTRIGRRFIARIDTGDGVVGAAVDVATGSGPPSWTFATSLDEGFQLDRLRAGELVWRRGDLATPGFAGFVSTWSAAGRRMQAAGDTAEAIRAAIPNAPVQPVARLGRDLAELVGAEAGAELVVSPWTVAHGSAMAMTPADWRRVQDLVDQGEVRRDERGRLFLYGRDGARVLELLATPLPDGRWLVRTFYGWTKLAKAPGKRGKTALVRPAGPDLDF